MLGLKCFLIPLVYGSLGLGICLLLQLGLRRGAVEGIHDVLHHEVAGILGSARNTPPGWG